jgi:hypothetical protein
MATTTSKPDLIAAAASGTGGTSTVADELTPIPTTAPSTIDAMKLSEQARAMAKKVDAINLDMAEVNNMVAVNEWKVRRSNKEKGNALADLVSLADMGFAWRDIARLVGVSVPAQTKWRRGEPISPENKKKIFGVTAACDYLASYYHVKEIASWFSIPLHDDAPITPIDLWVANRQDLFFEAARENAKMEADVLDKFEPNWREKYRSDFETFVGGDGELSLRMKDR